MQTPSLWSRLILLGGLAVPTGSAQPAGTALVRHAPVVNGRVEGSVHVLSPESVALSGGAQFTRDLLVPGMPGVRLNGQAALGATVDGPGAAVPATHQLTLSGNASLGRLVRRTDAVPLPPATAPTPPVGTRSIIISSSAQPVDDFAALRNLTLGAAAGDIAVPPGAYGDLAAAGPSSFTLGVAGATEPAVYSVQRLTLEGQARLRVAGPILLRLASPLVVNGGVVGSAEQPSWLRLELAAGDLALGGGARFHGYVVAPAGTVTLHGQAELVGGVASDRLVINGNALLRLLVPPNRPPQVALVAPPPGATFIAPATLTLQATATDPDGTIAKVEFFRGPEKVGEGTAPPFQVTLTSLAAGTYVLSARATDNAGASTDSAPVSINVVGNRPPTVALTAPANGATFIAPAAFTLTASAADPDGAVARVEFFDATGRIGQDLLAPFELPRTGVPAGEYRFVARATDNLGAAADSATVTIRVDPPNQRPLVALVAPPNGAVFPEPASFVLVATATDPDGAIAKVEFFRGTALLAERTAPPFEHSVTDLAAGSHVFTARATDTLGATADSPPLAITVNRPPTVAVTSPVAGATFLAPASFTLAASAFDADGSIARVEFFQGATRLGDDLAPPWEIAVTNLGVGLHSFTARAFDNHNAAATSAPVTVSVASPNQPPVVALTSPAAGTVFDAPASIGLAAAATDPDGTIARVEFFQGETKLGEKAAPPFEFIWNGVPPGAYSLTARAHDAAGGSATSAAVPVTVRVGLPYFTGFEAADGYGLGPLDGQVGWTAGHGALIAEVATSGARAIVLSAASPPVQASRGFPEYAGQAIAFVEVFARPAAAALAAEGIFLRGDAAHVAFVRAGAVGEIHVFDGAAGWRATGRTATLDATGQAAAWLRLTLREDFATKRWDVFVNGELVSCELAFADAAAARFERVTLGGASTAAAAFDDFFASFENPLFADADKDGLPDSWEQQHGLNPAAADRSGDLDGDGLSNIREFQAGTRPDRVDTDGDGLSDEWEVRYRLDPRRAATPTDDADGDGMPDLWEHLYGFNPQVNDAALDTDGDGASNLQEFNARSNPLDAFNGRALLTVSPTPNNTIEYAYDPSGRLAATAQPGLGQSTFGFDAASNLTSGATTTAPIVAWRRAHALPEFDPAVDADAAILAGDGLPNLAKYAFGFVPQNAVSGDQPVVSVIDIGGVRHLALRYRRPHPAPADLLYRVEVSADGTTWSSAADATVPVGTTISAGLAEITVRDATPAGSPLLGRRIRLAIERIVQP